MKLAITASADNLEAAMDERFGRCPFFCLVDTDSGQEPKFTANQGAKQGHGAGIKAAQQVVAAEATVVITGNVGPKAFAVLEQFDVSIYRGSGSVESALKAYSDGDLDEITTPLKAHHGKR